MVAKKNTYNKDSIKSYSALEATQRNPGMWCGDTTYSTQLVIEVYTNAVDEARIGHGDKIEIDIQSKPLTVKVTDHGQGFPINVIREEDGETIMQASFDVLNTTAKMNEEGIYEGTSRGAFGIGNKLTNFLSKTLTATSSQGKGTTETLYFEKGVFKDRKVEKKNVPAGTVVTFCPDPQYFEKDAIDYDSLRGQLTEIAALNIGLETTLIIDGKKEVFKSSKGVLDLLDLYGKGTKEISQRFSIVKKQGVFGLNLAMVWNNGSASKTSGYVNSGYTEGGAHLTAIKSTITRTFNKYANDNGLIKDGKNLKGSELEEGMILMFDMTSPHPQYDGQTKARVVRIDSTFATRTLTDELSLWLEMNPKSAKSIIDRALLARKAVAAATKARAAVERKAGVVTTPKTLKEKLQGSKKFIDCQSKNPKERELLLVEGMSAGASASEARDPRTQAIQMLRGVPLNTWTASEDRILANEEIASLIRSIGAGYGKSFDIKKMKFNRIVITADADYSGDQITQLMVAFFWKYMRPIVTEGRLYRALTPLYVIVYNNKEHYLYNDLEKEAFMKGKDVSKMKVSRNKGLGELDAADLKRLCFDVRNYEQLKVKNDKEIDEQLEIFVGKEAELRKDFLYTEADFMKGE